MPLPDFEGQVHDGPQNGDLVTMTMTKPPCKECSVLYGLVTLTDADGKHTGIANGTYLHHTASLTFGPGREMDWTGGGFNCGPGETPLMANIGPGIASKKPKAPKAPGLVRSLLPSFGVKVFLLGLNDGGANWYTDRSGKFKSGYYIRKFDQMFTEFEAMNYQPVPKQVYITMEVEYIPNRPKDYQDVAFVMPNVQDCKQKVDFPVPGNVFSKESKGWIVPYDGTIVSMLGHLHDGGTDIEFKLNNKSVCNSTASYGTQPDFVMKGSSSNDTWQALSHMVDCNDAQAVKKGDNLTITANYDLNKHPMRMGNTGEQETVMGLAFLHIAHK